jgi:hypothetical protein
LENPWKTRFLRVSALSSQKFPFVFNDQKFGFPNFQKDFFGRFGESQRIAAEKVWKLRFLTSALSQAVQRMPGGSYTITRLRIFRNRLSPRIAPRGFARRA